MKRNEIKELYISMSEFIISCPVVLSMLSEMKISISISISISVVLFTNTCMGGYINTSKVEGDTIY